MAGGKKRCRSTLETQGAKVGNEFSTDGIYARCAEEAGHFGVHRWSGDIPTGERKKRYVSVCWH